MNNFFHFLSVIRPLYKESNKDEYWCSCGMSYDDDYEIWKHIKERNND